MVIHDQQDKDSTRAIYGSDPSFHAVLSGEVPAPKSTLKFLKAFLKLLAPVHSPRRSNQTRLKRATRPYPADGNLPSAGPIGFDRSKGASFATDADFPHAHRGRRVAMGRLLA